jgi:hypothetical protein
MFFIFFAQTRKTSVFHNTLSEHIAYGDIHAYIFPNFVNILKCIFQIKGAYAYGIKSAFSLVILI